MMDNEDDTYDIKHDIAGIIAKGLEYGWDIVTIAEDVKELFTERELDIRITKINLLNKLYDAMEDTYKDVYDADDYAGAKFDMMDVIRNEKKRLEDI